MSALLYLSLMGCGQGFFATPADAALALPGLITLPWSDVQQRDEEPIYVPFQIGVIDSENIPLPGREVVISSSFAGVRLADGTSANPSGDGTFQALDFNADFDNLSQYARTQTNQAGFVPVVAAIREAPPSANGFEAVSILVSASALSGTFNINFTVSTEDTGR